MDEDWLYCYASTSIRMICMATVCEPNTQAIDVTALLSAMSA